MMIKTVSFIGMGALGILFGTHLIDTGTDVRYVMDDARYEKYQNRIFYREEKPYRLPMCRASQAEPSDLVILSIKYTGMEQALETMTGCIGEHTIVLSLMNGISSEELVAGKFGKEHLIYCVAHDADAIKEGDRLTLAYEGQLRIGVREVCQEKNLADVCSFFDRTGICYRVDADIMRRLWSKFMFNVGLNQCCLVYETNYGGLLSGEPRRTMIAAMREVIALSQAEGTGLTEADLNEYIGVLKSFSPESYPSMRQDGLAKRPSEVEMFAGTVLALAEKHGIQVPANEFLYQRVHEIEAGYGK